MKPLRLLPPVFLWIGLALLTAGIALRLLVETLGATRFGDWVWEAVFCLCVIGPALAAFARLAQEDELTQLLRLRAWHWAVWVQLLLVVGIYFLPLPGPLDASFLKMELAILQMGGLFVVYRLRLYYLLRQVGPMKGEPA